MTAVEEAVRAEAGLIAALAEPLAGGSSNPLGPIATRLPTGIVVPANGGSLGTRR